MKRLLLLALLVLPTIGIANSSTKSDPPPTCLPCGPQPPAATSVYTVAQ